MTMAWSEKSTNVRFMHGLGAALDGLSGLLRLPDAVDRAIDDFLSPERVVTPPMLPEPGGRSLPLAVPDWPTHINARVWDRTGDGTAPTILLVHGWEGQMYDLGPFVAPLLDRGFRVFAFDAPAHGRSFGDRSSLPEMAKAVAAVAKAAGPLHGAIGHSLGAAALMLALEQGLRLGRVVLAATPAEPMDYALLCAKAHRLDADETAEMLRRLDARLPRPITGLSLAAIADGLTVPALFLHATDDRIAQVGAALHVAALWKGARVRLEDGLGHRRLLKAPAVVAEAVAFLSAGIDRGNPVG